MENENLENKNAENSENINDTDKFVSDLTTSLLSLTNQTESEINKEDSTTKEKEDTVSNDKEKPLETVAVSSNGGNNKPPKKKKKHKKSDRPLGDKKTFTWAIVMLCVVLFCALMIGLSAFFAVTLCNDLPELKASDLDSADSTIIYDSEGNQIIELGMYIRQNVEYDEIPTCVIDAFLSIEDARYFTHWGVDIPRFTKAFISFVINGGSISSGGSTLTMQLIKNSYFQVDRGDDSTMAARAGMGGIKRKMQEIVLSLQATQLLSKQELFALSLNKFNFGNNIRGIQKAAEYYFGKDSKDLTLNEAAFLAGIINAPNAFNPYNELEKGGDNAYVNDDVDYLANANDKKNHVLQQMYAHGYISEEEYELNKNVRMEDLVIGPNKKFGNTNTYYQSFIDAVIEEVEEVTGKSPYLTAMNIYTSMDSHMQEYVYDMQNNPEKFGKYVFRHDDQQNALVVLNNQTGELVALGGGRNQADEARQFNRAVDSYINPGSTIKPVIEYALAFERLGYATSHTITDKPVFLYETDIAISNAYGQGYTGDMFLTEALGRSLNTPAIQLMDQLFKLYEDDSNYEHPEDPIIEYCKSIGFDRCNENTFDIQWAIGGKDCTVSPVQLAAAHGMLIHDGMYIKPHTIKRIEYRGKYNEIPDYVADTTGTRVLSSDAAYMTAYLLQNNIKSGWISQLNLLRRDYPVFGKTGTTNFSEAAYEYFNIPESAAKDQWLCTQTSNYTIVVWNGFDKLDEGAYFTVTDENYNLKCKMGSMLLDELMDHFKYDAHEIERPETVIEIEHIPGCFPYAKGSGARGLISSSSPYANLVNESEVPKINVGGTLYHTGIVDQGLGIVAIHWDEFNSYIEDGSIMDTSVTSVSGQTTVIASGRIYYPRYNFINPDMFFATITTGDGREIPVSSPLPTTVVDTGGSPGPYQVCGWTSADFTPKCSMQSGYKDPNAEQ